MWEDSVLGHLIVPLVVSHLISTELFMENPLGDEIEQAQKVYETLVAFFVNYSLQVIGALIILAIGYFVARAVGNWLTNFLKSKDLDVTLSELLGSMTYIAVLFCFIVISLGKFGISITPFIAALGAFTLGAGLAVQGIVGNYGAGFSIIFSRPFVVGNTLSVQGVSGVVERIALPYTVLVTEDGEKITVPNRQIIGQIIENSFENKLVETMVYIDVTADPVKVTSAIQAAIGAIDTVAAEPPPQVGIDGFSEYAMRIGVRAWVPTANYYHMKYTINAGIYDSLREIGVSLHVPRQDIRIVESATS